MIINLLEKTKNKKMNNVFIDNKYIFTLTDEEIFKLDIYEGKEITKEDIEYINNYVLFTKAKNDAIRYISYKMRTSKEIEKKLLENGFNQDVINKTINFLIEYGYVDDRLYTEKYIKDCENLKKWSVLKIRYALMEKGIEHDIIDELLIENNGKEIKKALYFLKKKNSLDKKDHIKLKSYLSRKGFKCNIINEAIKILFNGN